PCTLSYLFLEPGGRGRDQFGTGRIDQEHRGGVGFQEVAGALEQLGEQLFQSELRQSSVGDRFNTAQPLFPSLLCRYRPSTESLPKRSRPSSRGSRRKGLNTIADPQRRSIALRCWVGQVCPHAGQVEHLAHKTLRPGHLILRADHIGTSPPLEEATDAARI